MVKALTITICLFDDGGVIIDAETHGRGFYNDSAMLDETTNHIDYIKKSVNKMIDKSMSE